MMNLFTTTLTLVFCLQLSGQHLVNTPTQHTMSVTADAIIRVTPDQVVLRLGVQSKGEDLITTKKETATVLDKAITYCTKHGIPSKHIQTDYLSIRPTYNGHKQSKISHYDVQQILCVIIEDVPSYESMLTDLLLLGINRVDRVEFRTSKVKEYRQKVRKMAIEAAKEKAHFLAGETGVALGSIVNVAEYSPNHHQILGRTDYANFSQNIIEQQGDSADENLLAVGLISLKSTITLTYAVQ